MDEAAQCVGADDSDRPQNEQDYEDGPQHRCAPERVGELTRSAILGSRTASLEFADLALNLVLLQAVALLDDADELIALAGDHIQVVVGELTPPLTNFSPHLFPLAFDIVPRHENLLRRETGEVLDTRALLTPSSHARRITRSGDRWPSRLTEARAGNRAPISGKRCKARQVSGEFLTGRARRGMADSNRGVSTTDSG